MTVIQVENLGKKYTIGHQKGTRYQTLRDTLAHTGRGIVQRLRHPLSPNREIIDLEEIWALRDVNFEIKQGERVGIIGRNGAGKSTLLKILSRITHPTTGRVALTGRVASLLEVGTGFHPELSGRENIYLNGAILGMTRQEIKRKFDEIVAFAEVEKFLDTPVKHYSSGMYVRLAFAVAAHLEPEILLVDEVLAVGDAQFQKKCLGKMEDVAKEGRTVLFVSHNMMAILGLCSSVIWIDAGKIAEQGDTRSIVSRYLRDNNVPLGEIVYDSVGANGVCLTRTYVMDEELHIRPDIPYEKSFYLAFEYIVDSFIPGLRVGFKLHNERNVILLHAATSDSPVVDEKIGMPGQYCTRVHLPGYWFAPGRYYIELGIWSPRIKHHVHIPNALAFNIIADSIDSLGEEVLRPILKWDVMLAAD